MMRKILRRILAMVGAITIASSSIDLIAFSQAVRAEESGNKLTVEEEITEYNEIIDENYEYDIDDVELDPGVNIAECSDDIVGSTYVWYSFSLHSLIADKGEIVISVYDSKYSSGYICFKSPSGKEYVFVFEPSDENNSYNGMLQCRISLDEDAEEGRYEAIYMTLCSNGVDEEVNLLYDSYFDVVNANDITVSSIVISDPQPNGQYPEDDWAMPVEIIMNRSLGNLSANIVFMNSEELIYQNSVVLEESNSGVYIGNLDTIHIDKNNYTLIGMTLISGCSEIVSFSETDLPETEFEVKTYSLDECVNSMRLNFDIVTNSNVIHPQYLINCGTSLACREIEALEISYDNATNIRGSIRLSSINSSDYSGQSMLEAPLNELFGYYKVTRINVRIIGRGDFEFIPDGEAEVWNNSFKIEEFIPIKRVTSVIDDEKVNFYVEVDERIQVTQIKITLLFPDGDWQEIGLNEMQPQMYQGNIMSQFLRTGEYKILAVAGNFSGASREYKAEDYDFISEGDFDFVEKKDMIEIYTDYPFVPRTMVRYFVRIPEEWSVDSMTIDVMGPDGMINRDIFYRVDSCLWGCSFVLSPWDTQNGLMEGEYTVVSLSGEIDGRRFTLNSIDLPKVCNADFVYETSSCNYYIENISRSSEDSQYVQFDITFNNCIDDISGYVTISNDRHESIDIDFEYVEGDTYRVTIDKTNFAEGSFYISKVVAIPDGGKRTVVYNQLVHDSDTTFEVYHEKTIDERIEISYRDDYYDDKVKHLTINKDAVYEADSFTMLLRSQNGDNEYRVVFEPVYKDIYTADIALCEYPKGMYKVIDLWASNGDEEEHVSEELITEWNMCFLFGEYDAGKFIENIDVLKINDDLISVDIDFVSGYTSQGVYIRLVNKEDSTMRRLVYVESSGENIRGALCDISDVPGGNYIVDAVRLSYPSIDDFIAGSGIYELTDGMRLEFKKTSIVDSGKAGDYATWSLDSDGVMTFSGMGWIYSYNTYSMVEGSTIDWHDAPWLSYNDDIKKIVVEEGILGLPRYNFQGCKNIEEVYLSEGLEYLGTFFGDSTKLKELTLPGSLKRFDSNIDTSDITTIYYDGTMCELAKVEYASYLLESHIVYTKDDLHNFDAGEIDGTATASKSATLTFTCRECGAKCVIEYYAYNGQASIKIMSADVSVMQFNVPDTIDGNKVVSFVGGNYWENKLRKIMLPQGLVEIGNSAFNNWTYLEKVEIPDTVTKIGRFAFYGCSGLESVVIPLNVKKIEDYTFMHCTNLTSVEFSEGLEEIGSCAFIECDSLLSITIPKTVRRMGSEEPDYPEEVLGVLYNNVTSSWQAIPEFVIHGYSNTVVETYARKYGIKFVSNGAGTINVSYELNGGINNNNITEYRPSQGNLILNSPIKEGYEFEGWYTDADYNLKVTELTPNINSDITLYAKWRFMYASYGYRVTLGGNFDLKYYLKISEELLNNSSIFVKFIIDGDNQYATDMTIAGEYAMFNCEVPIKNVSSNIEAILVIDGMYYQLPDYCIRTYLETIIANEEDIAEYAFAKDIATAILDYSAYAQLYFDYNTDNLANSVYTSGNVESITPEDMEYYSVYEYKSKQNADFEYVGASLICNSDTDLRLYFINVNHLSLEEIEEIYDCYVVGGSNAVVDIDADGDIFYITLRSIPAMELDNRYHFVIFDGDDSIIVEYSPMTYIATSLNGNNNELKNLCKAMYWYNKCADEYYERYALAK